MMDELLKLYPVLSQLDDDLLARIAASLQRLEFPGGTMIFDERQPCRGFPFILTGGIRVIKAAANGRELPLYRVLPGQACLITSSCLLGHVDYNVRGITEGDTSAVILPRPLFDELLDRPAFRDFFDELHQFGHPFRK